MMMSPRTRTPLRRRTLFATLAALLLLEIAGSFGAAAPALAHAAPAATQHAAAPPVDDLPVNDLPVTAVRLPAAQLAAVTGGTCTTCSSDDGSSTSGGGGGGGGTGSSGSLVPAGSPYWTTYRVVLTSSSYTPASLASRINNWSNLTINGTFGYTRKVVRDVQFSGGFASFVSASVGGEVSLSTSTSVSYPVPPMSYGKLYVKYYTARKTYYGHEYQDYNDGSRTIVASDSGPYQSTSTVLGYVTGPL